MDTVPIRLARQMILNRPRWRLVQGLGFLLGAAASGCVDTVVETARVTSVDVFPGSFTLSVSEARTVQAMLFGYGHQLGDRSLSWSSSNSSVAKVSGFGETATVTGVSGGRATIFAESEGIRGQAQVTIPTFSLTVVLSEEGGSGGVTSDPSGINCGSQCTRQFGSGLNVVLTAMPSGNSDFVGWGGCPTVNGSRCTIKMAGDRSVTARFGPSALRPVVTANDFQWVDSLSGCDSTYPDGRTRHEFSFSDPDGNADLSRTAVENQWRGSGSTTWRNYSFTQYWYFSGNGFSGTATRSGETCWRLSDATTYLEERVRIRDTDGNWSDWKVKRLYR